MPLTDHRTQLYLTEEQYRAAKKLAAERGSSLAGVIREALGAYLASAEEAAAGASWEDDSLAKAAGTLELAPLSGGGTDLDAEIDASVYDEV